MSNLSIKRVLSLPGTPDASTLYIVRGANGTDAELYFSSEDGQSVRRVMTRQDVQDLVELANAATADTLSTARQIASTGDVSWQVTFDGSGNVSGVSTLANTGVVAGEYVVMTTDAKGRITAGRNLAVEDVPSLPGSKIISDLTVNTSGNAGTATALQTGRTINGVNFDGTQNITVNAVDSTPRIAVSEKGVANGVATLDTNGLVPASQLPSFVDDVLEAANFAALPVTGNAGKIYLTLDNNKVYRWTGTVYLEIPSGVGTADTAVALATPRNIAATGDISWQVTFDGTSNVTAAATLANSGITAGEHAVATYDAKGRATAGRALVMADIPTLDYTKVLSAQSIQLGASEW